MRPRLFDEPMKDFPLKMPIDVLPRIKERAAQQGISPSRFIRDAAIDLLHTIEENEADTGNQDAAA